MKRLVHIGVAITACFAISSCAVHAGDEESEGGDELIGQAVQSLGGLVISSPLKLSTSTVVSGQALTATVTYQNTSASPITIGSLVIASRPPGGTHGGGPFADLSPTLTTTTINPGATVTLSASRTYSTSEPIGRWEAYSTYKDSANVWHDGPSTYFIVSKELFHTAYPHAFVNAQGSSVRLNGFNARESTVYNPQNGWSQTQAHFATITSKGFNAVRFTLDWFSFEPSQGVFNQTAINALTTAVANAKAAGLYIILDPIHMKSGGTVGVPGWAAGSGDDVDQINNYALPYLQKMASLFKDEPNVIAYDVVNEPHMTTADQNRMLPVYSKLVQGIRTIDPDKICILEPIWGDSGLDQTDFSLLSDKLNIVWSIHDYFAGCDYDGFNGAGVPVGCYVWNGTSGYPSSTPDQLERHVTVILDRLATVGLPAYVGEYGLGDGVANHDLWLQQQTAIFNKYDLSRTYWEWHSGGSMSAQNLDYTWKPWVDLLLVP
ncbi:cellulase family glycosylhydrolase [Sorangium sp. So ce136]|uniref:glycoside hydrolase family 5 protein n=1 Tax=Sorangium sp. So ce136 TaxID=3133284 RepID=UPI003F0D7C07